MRNAPTCGKCSKQHYNFVKCDDLPEAKEAARLAAERRTPHIVRQPLPEGVREWGDNLVTLRRIGENRLMGKNIRPVVGGRVIYPDGEGPKAA